MRTNSSKRRIARHAGATVAVLIGGLLGSQSAIAAVGDTLSYLFNSSSTGGAVPTVNQATLVLTESASGVDFTVSPNWGATTGDRVDQLQFAFSGEAISFVDGLGPNAAFSTSFGSIDSGYTTTNLVVLAWPSGANNANLFDAADASSSWSLNGASITLADFTVFATATSTKPTPGFGVISMPGASPSNWVATGPVVVSAVPEPATYGLMLAGLGALALVGRRRRAD